MTRYRLFTIIRNSLIYLFLILGIVATLAPFVWMFLTSFKSSGGIFAYPPEWLPKHPTFAHYQKLFSEIRFLLHFKNSLIVAISATTINLFLSSMAGFAFAKYKFPGREKIFTFLLASMMIPGQVTMMPIFLLLKKIGLLNSYFGLIATGAVSVFGIFLIRQFMISIPNDLIESARIDGCSEFRIYWNIMLPLCKPVLATLGIFSFMGAWNDFLWPLIVMITEDMYTLPVALANLNGQYPTEFGLLMAGAVVVVLPILLIFIFAQKFIIKGIATTGLKE